jgi:hypothetical protein
MNAEEIYDMVMRIAGYPFTEKTWALAVHEAARASGKTTEHVEAICERMYHSRMAERGYDF